jgi:hypothetical protein
MDAARATELARESTEAGEKAPSLSVELEGAAGEVGREAPPPSADPPSDGRAMRGALVIDGAAPDELAEGTLRLLLQRSGGVPTREIQAEVTAGAFSFVASAGETRCEVTAIRVGARHARALHPVHDLGPLPLLVEARWLDGLLLRVVRAGTGVDLDGVDVHAPGRGFDIDDLLDDGVYPDRGLRTTPALLRDQTSPFPLPAAAGTTSYFVRAPGYAWNRIWIDGDSGERRVELHPAAALEVQLEGTPPRASLTLTVTAVEENRVLLQETLPKGPGPHLYEGLPPQAVRAELSRRIDGVTRAPLVDTTIDLREGETSRWVVQDVGSKLDSLAGLDLRVVADVDLSGLERVQAVCVERNPTSERPPVRAEVELTWNESTRALESSIRGLPAGEYDLLLSRWNARRRCTLAAARTEPVTVHVRPTARLLVRARFEDGTAPSSADVRFRMRTDLEDIGWESLAGDPSPGGWSAQLEPGAIVVSCVAAGARAKSQDALLVDPETEVTFELARADSRSFELVLSTYAGDSVYPIRAEDWILISVESLDGTGAALGRKFSGAPSSSSSFRFSSCSVSVTAPGSYRVTVPKQVAGTPSDLVLFADVSEELGGSLRIDCVE